MVSLTEVLDEFSRHQQKRVLAIKGKWGVGKTYAWKKYCSQSDRFKENALSYVSLFGAASISEVKQRILQKAIPLHGRKPEKLIKGIQTAWPFAKLLPKVGDFTNLAQALGELFIKKFIICLDDIERRGSTLELSSVLGLISFLKEEADSRVVLIFNEDELTKGDAQTLKTYREKLIDMEFTYAPTVAENAALIFKSTKDQFILETLRSLDVRNIRVMQQVAWNLEHFEPMTGDLLPSLREDFLRNVVILTCLFHERGDEINFDKLDRNTFVSLMLSKEEEGKKEFSIFRQANYEYSDSDRCVVEYLRHGYLDSQALRKSLEERDERERKKQIRDKLWNVWSLVNANFRATESEVVREFTAFLDQNATDLVWKELTDVCDVLEKLEPKVERHKWERLLICKHAPTLDLEGVKFFKGVSKDPAVTNLLEARQAELMRNVTQKEIIFRIAEKQSWHPDDLAALDTYSQSDYTQWLSQEVHSDLFRNLREFRKIFNPQSEDPASRSVGSKLENALKEIASMTMINRLRVKLVLGIDVPE
jgi:hypothetical protein